MKIPRIKSEGMIKALSSLISIVFGLLIGLIILLIFNPTKAFSGFTAILTGGLSDLKNVGQVLYYATPLIMTGLSVGFAKKAGMFNIGAPGQFIIGAYIAVLIGVKCTFFPPIIHWIVALICAMVAGALWGILPGLLKAKNDINEVIICIMMNYIGMSTVNLLIRRTIFDPTRNESLQPVRSAVLPKLGFDNVFVAGGIPSSVNSGVIIAILMSIIVYLILQKTKLGFELKAVGHNRDSARYAGINDKKIAVTSMSISGALAGLGGALSYLSGAGTGIPVIDVLAAEGFSGIPIALLAMCNPVAIIFAALFISYLKVGGLTMQVYGYVPQIVDIITAIIIYFSAFALFFSQKISYKWNKKKQQTEASSLQKGETKKGEIVR